MFKGHGGKSAGGWKKGGSKFGGGKPWEKKGGDRGGFDRAEMHTATCAQCNKSCQVPFKPNGKKPIYCSDCFKRDGDRGGEAEPKRFTGEKRPYVSTPRHAEGGGNTAAIEARLKSIETKLDELLEVLTVEEGEE